MSAYQELGLPENASREEVRRAYRRLALQFHPDRNPEPTAEARFIRITEAYQEIMEGAKPFPGFDLPGYYSAEEARRRERREYAEKMARMRYEEFIAETEAFKSSRYYYIVMAAIWLFFAMTITFGIVLMFYPAFLAYTRRNGYYLWGELLSIPFGALLIYGIFNTYESLRPYIRHKGEGQKWRLPELDDFLKIFDVRLHPLRATRNTLYKLLLLVPLSLSMAAITDYLLPRDTHKEVVVNWNLAHERARIQHIYTRHYAFRSPPDLVLFNGDTLELKTTRILNIVTGIKPVHAGRGINQNMIYPPNQSIYVASLFLPLVLLLVSIFGFLSDNDTEILAALVISLAMVVIAYNFLV